jgi:hypothetical protein
MLTLQQTHEQSRYTQGWEKLKEIDGDAGEKVNQLTPPQADGVWKQICSRT